MSSRPSANKFVKILLDNVPELKSIHEEHVGDYDELLPHVFMGDVARYVIKAMKENSVDSIHSVRRILDLFETAMKEDQEIIKELISVSFLENVSEHKSELKHLKGLMPVNLRNELELYET